MAYFVGTYLIIQYDSKQCNSNFFCFIVIIIIVFFFRVAISFCSFYKLFSPFSVEREINGVSEEEFKHLKIIKVHENNVTKFEHTEGTCSICWENLNIGEEVRIMMCPGRHYFHRKCIDKWLKFKRSCPYC